MAIYFLLYILYLIVLLNLKVRFDNKDFTLKFTDVYSGMIEIFKSDNNRFDENRFKEFIRK